MSAKDQYFTLNTGANIPMVGLGTAGINGPDITLNVLNDALELGYRLFDTAATYENEKSIGYALEKLLPKYNLTRKDIFITTKLHPDCLGDHTIWGLKKSLKDLNCGYIDLFLINWPGFDGVIPDNMTNAKYRNKTWKKMIQAVNKKLIKHIGVCSYTIYHLEELLANCHGIKPAVNQIEFHPFCRDRRLLDLCRQEKIFVQAYGSLGGGMWSDLINNETIANCCDLLGKTPAQVLLRWSIQQKVGVIPKSQDRGHLFSNMQINFNIPDEEMLALSTIKKFARYDRDPNLVP